MAFEEMREGIGSLDAGAPDITYEGNEGPQAPQQMTDAMLKDEYDNYVYDLLEQRPEATPMSFEEFKQWVIAEGKMSGGQPLPNDPTKPVNPWTPKPKGIQMAAQGGRIGLYAGTPEEGISSLDFGLQSPQKEEMLMAGGGDRGWKAQMLAEDLAQEEYGMEFYDLPQRKQMEVYQIALDMIDEQGMAKGGRAGYNQGGRTGFQTGGTTIDQKLQPDYIEALGKTYAADLTRQAGIPSITQATSQMPGETPSQFAQRQAQAQQYDITKQSMGALAPQVAAQDAYQTAAYGQAVDPTYGLGAYQPYTADARAAAQAAGALTGPMTTQQLTDYMSPYQQQVIDATMTEFGEQEKRRENERAAAALGIPGAYGGGREGVQKAEYQAASDRNRASLLAQLNQQGFQQAQAGRQQDFANQQALATQQAGLGTQALGNVQRQIAGLGTLGATQQAQTQAGLDASRQFAQMAVNEPQQRLGMLGQGVTGLMGGMQGAGTTLGQAPPTTSPLGTALGIGETMAGIYGMMNR